MSNIYPNLKNGQKNSSKQIEIEISRTSGGSMDSLSSKYENIVLLCYFNSCIDDFPMIGLSETYKLRNLVKHPTCF